MKLPRRKMVLDNRWRHELAKEATEAGACRHSGPHDGQSWFVVGHLPGEQVILDGADTEAIGLELAARYREFCEQYVAITVDKAQ